jgi:hypothetical protein
VGEKRPEGPLSGAIGEGLLVCWTI